MSATYYWSSVSSGDATAGANWTNAADGTTGTAPTTGDTAVFRGIPGVALANIDPSDLSGITLAALTIEKTFTPSIGNASVASASFYGYLKIGATAVNVDTTGSRRVKLNLGSVQSTITVSGTGGSSLDTGLEPLRIVGTHASNAMSVLAGTVGVGTNLPGEAATFATINVCGSGSVNTGSNVTLTTVTAASSATLTIGKAGTTLTVTGSAAVVTGGATKWTTANISGTATFNQRPASGNAIDTLNLYSGGTADFSNNPASGTVATLNHYAGSKWSVNSASPGHITVTAYNKLNGGVLSLSST